MERPTIHFIALDAQKDAEGANYRFDIDKATYEMLVKEIPAYASMAS